MHQMVEEDRVVLDESFEFEIPCEVPTLEAGWDCGTRPAEWIAFRSIVCTCGVVVRLVCNHCRVKYQEMMAAHAFICCARCGEETKGFDRFEPLGSRS